MAVFVFIDVVVMRCNVMLFSVYRRLRCSFYRRHRRLRPFIVVVDFVMTNVGGERPGR